MENTTALLRKRGTLFHGIGKALIIAFLVGIGTFLTIILVCALGWGVNDIPYVLELDSYTIVNILTCLSYLAISVGGVGFPFYFFGLHFLGLAQIAENTSVKRSQ